MLPTVSTIATTEARSALGPAVLWARLLDERTWPVWADVQWVVFEGGAVEGAYATIKPRRGRQTAWRIATVEPERRFVLQLTIGPLAALELALTIAADAAGSRLTATVVTSGPLARLLAGPARRLGDGLPPMLARFGGADG